jgi:hypothetical protein
MNLEVTNVHGVVPILSYFSKISLPSGVIGRRANFILQQPVFGTHGLKLLESPLENHFSNVA